MDRHNKYKIDIKKLAKEGYRPLTYKFIRILSDLLEKCNYKSLEDLTAGIILKPKKHIPLIKFILKNGELRKDLSNYRIALLIILLINEYRDPLIYEDKFVNYNQLKIFILDNF